MSDIHVGTSERNEARAQRLVAHLAGLPRPVDAVLITGDIADRGAPEEYEKVRALIATNAAGSSDATFQTRPAAVLGRHDNVVAILTGHAHSPAATTFAGLPLLISPSVISTSTLPWDGEGLIDEAAPAALAYHVVDDERRLITHFRVVL